MWSDREMILVLSLIWDSEAEAVVIHVHIYKFINEDGENV